MARSEYIYVVTKDREWDVEAHVLAVFTVRRELLSWLREQSWTRGDWFLRDVWRHRDACPGYNPEDITEDITAEIRREST